MKNERGITLVALVITVIVLIILAGVTLSTLVGDNGIITKAQEAKQNMANAAAEEDKLIQNLLNEIKGIEAGGGEIEVPEGTIEFGEVTWSNGQAEVEILANTAGETLQYQINGTAEESWQEIRSGEKVTGLHHGDEVHARLWNGSIASVSKSTTIKDEKKPEVKVTVGEITSNSIAVEVEVTEEESGLVETETYQYYLGEALAGKSISNSYVYEGLEQETEYNLVVKVQDKVGNEGKGSATATTDKAYPTIESTLSEGKYVWYTDAFGIKQKCIVLYGPENSNYDSYGVQVITTDTVENVTLGSSNFNTNRDIYNSLVTTLNKEAEKYRKKDDGIAELARCVGSKPDNPNYDGAGMYTRSDSWFSSYNNTFKNKDNNYIADWNQMKNVVVNGKGIHNIGKYYWLVSRSVIADSSSSTFLVRHVDSSGELHGDNLYNGSLCLVPSNGNPGVNRYAYGLRPIFHLKSGIKVIGGDGSEGNPYTLAP